MNTPTPRKSKCDRTPTKAKCDRTPTPRTNEINAAKRPSGLRACAIGISKDPDVGFMSVVMNHAADKMEQLERELTAAREEIERLQCSGIHSCHDNCERPNCVLRREIKILTEQRDGLRSGIDYASDQLSKVTEQRDEARKLAEKYRYLSCDSQEEADAEVLPWENNQPTEQ